MSKGAGQLDVWALQGVRWPAAAWGGVLEQVGCASGAGVSSGQRENSSGRGVALPWLRQCWLSSQITP